MIKEVELKSIFINEKKKDGTMYLNKNNEPFKMAVIESVGGHKASMYCGKFQQKDLQTIMTWKPGQKVRVNLEEDGQFINFSFPSKTDELEERVLALEKAVFNK